MKQRRSLAHLLIAAVVLAVIGIAATAWCLNHGYTLYYGDAEAHLNIARRIVDSRTPGPEQIGTVWLPLPHLAMIPFVLRDEWWRTGLAGAIPSTICFVLAGTFLFAAARRANVSAIAAVSIFALNPNILYLQSTPMTESLFATSLAAILWATLWFRDSQNPWAIVAAAVASNAASLTRYEGWFLIPFITIYFFIAAKRKWHGLLFAGIAALAPASWLAHNLFYYGNALEFYNGPWSAMAIYKRSLAGGMQPYPGDHDWRAAFQYYLTAARLVAGWPVLIVAVVGAAIALWRRIWWPLAFLALPPLFYVWSMHSSGTPIFVPTLWPHSHYNTRYAVAILPLAAFALGALAIRRWMIPVVVAISLTSWIVFPPICWKESEVNSATRRAWTHEAAHFLSANYRHGDGIMSGFGDLTGVLREAGIPLRESLHEGNGPAWTAAVVRPDLFLHEEWILGFAGDDATTAALRADRRGKHYQLVKQVIIKGGPVVEIWKRQ